MPAIPCSTAAACICRPDRRTIGRPPPSPINRTTSPRNSGCNRPIPRPWFPGPWGLFFSIVNRTYSLEEIHDPQVDSLFNTLYGDTIADIFGSATNADGSSYLPRDDSYLNQITGHDRQLAGFGEAVWSITDQLKLTGGMRYSRVDYSFASYADGPQNGGPTYGSGVDHEQPKTYRAGLEFQQNPNNLYYFTYSTGFRVGGANSVIPYSLCKADFDRFGIPDNPASVQIGHTVKSFEVGAAKNNFDNRVRLATSVVLHHLERHSADRDAAELRAQLHHQLRYRRLRGRRSAGGYRRHRCVHHRIGHRL